MTESQTARNFPIRTVSELTGVNAVTLRAWERRYGLIKPMRTAKGHRIYTTEHIELINNVCQKLNAGMSISHIANELLQRGGATTSEAGDVWQRYVESVIACIERFDERGLDAIYNEANSIYPVDTVTNMLIIPILKIIGERWSNRTGSVAEEHYFSVYLRNKIGARLHHQNGQNQGRSLIVACMPGEHHEFGILLFALSADSRGYRVILLGADMPLDELPTVAERSGADGIVLAGSEHLDCRDIGRSLQQLAADTPVPIFVGGSVINHCSTEIDQTRCHLLGADITAGIATIASELASTGAPQR